MMFSSWFLVNAHFLNLLLEYITLSIDRTKHLLLRVLVIH